MTCAQPQTWIPATGSAITSPSLREITCTFGGNSDAQREYAASDVRYLHRLKEQLDERLARENRTELAQACFDFLPARARLDLAGWAEQDILAHDG